MQENLMKQVMLLNVMRKKTKNGVRKQMFRSGRIRIIKNETTEEEQADMKEQQNISY